MRHGKPTASDLAPPGFPGQERALYRTLLPLYNNEQDTFSPWAAFVSDVPDKAEQLRTMDISDNSMDAISLYFNMRTVDDKEIKEGFARDLEMVLEDTVRYLKFRYEGREVKKIKNLGKFNTLKFRCKIATSDGYAFQDGTEFEVWISDDRNKIPLYIKSPIKVGSVQAYLTSYEGLRYPLDSFIKK